MEKEAKVYPPLNTDEREVLKYLQTNEREGFLVRTPHGIAYGLGWKPQLKIGDTSDGKSVTRVLRELQRLVLVRSTDTSTSYYITNKGRSWLDAWGKAKGSAREKMRKGANAQGTRGLEREELKGGNTEDKITE